MSASGRISVNLKDFRNSHSVFGTYVFYDEFQIIFNELIAKYTNRQENRVLVILVDDLDRCMPEKLIETLETLKLFLDSKNCAFVVALDPFIMKKAIEAHYLKYGLQGINAEEFVNKIIQDELNIPPLRAEDVQTFIGSLANIEGQVEGLLKLIASTIPTNPRRIKTFLNHAELQWAVISNSNTDSNLSKNGLIEWLILNEVCSAFCEKLKMIEDNEKRVKLFEDVKQFARANSQTRSTLLINNDELKDASTNSLLLKILAEGIFELTPKSIGIYIHLSPAPSLSTDNPVTPAPQESGVNPSPLQYQKLMTEIVYVNLPGPNEPVPGMNAGLLLHGFLAEVFTSPNNELNAYVSHLSDKWNVHIKPKHGK